MKRRPVADAWASFERNVVPPSAGATQRQEMRLAFYAGAHSLFTSILKGLSPGAEPQPSDLAMLDDISAEFDEHLVEVRKLGKG